MSDALSDITKEQISRKDWKAACDLIAFRLYKHVRFYEDKEIRDRKASDLCNWFTDEIKSRIEEMVENRGHLIVKKSRGHKGHQSKKAWSRRNNLVKAKKAEWLEPKYRASSDDAWAAAGLDELDNGEKGR